MRPGSLFSSILFLLLACVARGAEDAEKKAPLLVPIAKQQPNTWVKRSPLAGGPRSPRLGYEASWAYDPVKGKMIRWGAHDPGGGGPQLTETWTYDPITSKWEYLRTNNNPPGNCCCRENVFVRRTGKFYRFSYPSFGHGWYWDRSRYLREDSVWTFDLAEKRWTNMRPGKEPALNVGKPAFTDSLRNMIWVYDKKLRVYDYHTNTWLIVNRDKRIGKRTYAGMALDPQIGKIVLFGDHYQSDPRTWVYDIKTDKWTDMKPKTSPPGIRSCPTLVFDSYHNKFILLVLADRWDTKDAAKRRMETWVYDLPKNTWTKMNPPKEPDYSGTRGRLMRYLPELNIVILEGRTRNEQQVWTYRYKQLPPPAPPPPYVRKLSVSTQDGGKALLQWAKAGEGGYKVYRGEGAEPWKIEMKAVTPKPVKDVKFLDTGLKAGTVYWYHLTTMWGEAEGPPTPRVRAQPGVVVSSRVDVLAKDKVVFSWTPSAQPDVAGYVVERAVLKPISAAQKVRSIKQYLKGTKQDFMVEKAALGEFKRLTPKPIAAASFTDKVDLAKKVEIAKIYWQPYFGSKGLAGNKAYDMTKPGCPYTIYAYRVRAVNRLGVESGPSPYQMTIPNEVKDLYSKEVGTHLKLRWAASPHKSIKGYLVYRLNGRGFKWDKNSHVELLTLKPIKDTTFTDTKTVVNDKYVGGQRARYYVVVVDALGQQGLPSHAVWGFRPWRKHYAPWVPEDGWHQ